MDKHGELYDLLVKIQEHLATIGVEIKDLEKAKEMVAELKVKELSDGGGL